MPHNLIKDAFECNESFEIYSFAAWRDVFLFWICSAKYSTALHSLFNIFEKAWKIQRLSQRRDTKIQYVRTKFERARARKRQYCTQQLSRILQLEQITEQDLIWNGFKNYRLGRVVRLRMSLSFLYAVTYRAFNLNWSHLKHFSGRRRPGGVRTWTQDHISPCVFGGWNVP